MIRALGKLAVRLDAEWKTTGYKTAVFPKLAARFLAGFRPANDDRPSVTHDGLTIFFDSDRYGTLGGPDLYYSTRSNTHEPFGPAIHLESLSSPVFDARPFISWDGTMLIFSSARTGSTSPAPDMWFSVRAKAVGHR